MSPEYLAIAGLFSALQGVTALIIKMQQDRIGKLETQLDDSNKASRDLIALQAEMLRSKGVQIIAAPREGA